MEKIYVAGHRGMPTNLYGLKAGLAAAYQDFMSQLLAEESSFLKSQTVTSIPSLRAQRGNPSPSPTQP